MTKKPVILVVDDEPAIRQAFKLWLEEQGYPVYTASCQAEAIRVLEEYPIALCLIDLKLKDENGLEISQELKKRDSLLKIIILTAYPSYNSAIDAVKMGIYDYIPKSMDQDDILEKIKDALNNRQEEIDSITCQTAGWRKMILVCHHMMIKEGFQNFCRDEPQFSLTHTYHSVDYIKTSDFNNQAGLVLICKTCNQKEIEHPQIMLSRIFPLFPKARLAIINSDFTDKEKIELISLGIRGFLEGNVSREVMRKALKAILNGEYWVSRKLTDSLLTRFIQGAVGQKHKTPDISFQLSRREIELLQAMASGLSNFDISEKLFISEKTVKAHINHIFKKMKVKSRTQAVMKAMDTRII